MHVLFYERWHACNLPRVLVAKFISRPWQVSSLLFNTQPALLIWDWGGNEFSYFYSLPHVCETSIVFYVIYNCFISQLHLFSVAILQMEFSFICFCSSMILQLKVVLLVSTLICKSPNHLRWRCTQTLQLIAAFHHVSYQNGERGMFLPEGFSKFPNLVCLWWIQ